MIKNNNYPYIVMTSTITVGGITFYSGVSFRFEQDNNRDIIINYNGDDYVIPKWACIMTTRPTREENISIYEYQSKKYNDKTTEYFEPVRKAYGIDMKLNYAPQFRDGENPHKDGKNMENK